MKSEVYLVFNHDKHWFQRMLKPGFGHIYILKKDEYNWQILEPCCRLLHFGVLNFDVKTDLIQKIATSKTDPITNRAVAVQPTILRVTLDYEMTNKPFISLWPQQNCVGTGMYVLGISKFICTPYQLYKFLLRQIKRGKFIKPITNIKIM